MLARHGELLLGIYPRMGENKAVSPTQDSVARIFVHKDGGKRSYLICAKNNRSPEGNLEQKILFSVL